MSCKIISICLPKGGVGKTTTAVNLAASLAVAEKQTMLIDVDPFGASAMALGFTPEKIKAGISEVFSFTHSLDHAIHKTELEYLDFVPSNVNSIQRDDRFSKIAENRVVLKNALRGFTQQYEYIIIDCPPLMRGIVSNALTASTSVLVPIRCGHFALEAIAKLFKYVEYIKEIANPELYIEGIVMTMYESNTKVTEISERELKLRYNKYLFKTTIPRNHLLTESTFYGKPVILYNVNSNVSMAYLELAYELINKNKEGKIV
ncbi:MAG: ParA family protein [Ignavibacteria bacterium]|jgi:chromosome partitioning protein